MARHGKSKTKSFSNSLKMYIWSIRSKVTKLYTFYSYFLSVYFDCLCFYFLFSPPPPFSKCSKNCNLVITTTWEWAWTLWSLVKISIHQISKQWMENYKQTYPQLFLIFYEIFWLWWETKADWRLLSKFVIWIWVDRSTWKFFYEHSSRQWVLRRFVIAKKKPKNEWINE